MSGLNGDWYEALKGEFSKPYYRKLFETVNEEYRTKLIFPPAQDIFNAFHLTPLKDVKVVILGQDPYHNNGQAHGLSFSVQKGVDIPPSLVNIYKELHDDLGCTIPNHGCLTKYRAGCINVEHCADSTSTSGELSQRNRMGRIHRCSDSALNSQDRPIVFILWGAPAQRKKRMLTNPKHLILEAPHPSPLAAYRGFFGSKPFSQTNAFLEKNGIEPIDWQIE